MNIIALIGCFGGGVLGAVLGGTQAFAMTGVVAIIAGIAYSAGAVAGDFANLMAFGALLAPYAAFIGGVAAEAYAKKIGKIDSVSSCTACVGFADPSILCVAGVFGMIGYVIATGIGLILPTAVATDNPGFTVFWLGCIIRIIFGKRGLLSDASVRKPFSTGSAFATNIVWGLSVALGVSCTYVVMAEAMGTEVLGMYHIVIFGLAAVSLLLLLSGTNMPAWHHTGIISAEAVMAGYAIGGAGTGIILGVIMGCVANILADFDANMFNTDVDSHIDPPAFAIWICTIILSIIKYVAL